MLTARDTSATHKSHGTVSTTDTRQTLSTTNTSPMTTSHGHTAKSPSAPPRKKARGETLRAKSSGHSPTGSVPTSFSSQLCVGTRRPIPEDGQKDLLRQRRPRYPLARSPARASDTRLGSQERSLSLLPLRPATRSAQRPQGLAKREARGPGGRSSQDSAASRRQQAARGSPRPSRRPAPHRSQR